MLPNLRVMSISNVSMLEGERSHRHEETLVIADVVMNKVSLDMPKSALVRVNGARVAMLRVAVREAVSFQCTQL